MSSDHEPAPGDDQDDDVRFWARLQGILDNALISLSEPDLEARLAHCRATGQFGIRAEEADATGEYVRFMWGGATLAVVERALFNDDAYLDDVKYTLVPAAPDDASALTGE